MKTHPKQYRMPRAQSRVNPISLRRHGCKTPPFSHPISATFVFKNPTKRSNPISSIRTTATGARRTVFTVSYTPVMFGVVLTNGSMEGCFPSVGTFGRRSKAFCIRIKSPSSSNSFFSTESGDSLWKRLKFFANCVEMGIFTKTSLWSSLIEPIGLPTRILIPENLGLETPRSSGFKCCESKGNWSSSIVPSECFTEINTKLSPNWNQAGTGNRLKPRQDAPRSILPQDSGYEFSSRKRFPDSKHSPVIHPHQCKHTTHHPTISSREVATTASQAANSKFRHIVRPSHSNHFTKPPKTCLRKSILDLVAISDLLTPTIQSKLTANHESSRWLTQGVTIHESQASKGTRIIALLPSGDGWFRVSEFLSNEHETTQRHEHWSRVKVPSFTRFRYVESSQAPRSSNISLPEAPLRPQSYDGYSAMMGLV